ncbi:MAG: CopD family protein [Chlamydiales bacterium]|nr:CopD family protein [Chlamydiales bacterium]
MDLLKFFHIASVFFWISSLLLVTRLLAWAGRDSLELYRKAYFLIELPAMCVAVVSGLALLFLKPDVNFTAPWLHIKLTFAFVLIICDLLVLAQVTRAEKEGGQIAFKILHWITVFSLLAVLGAIYIVKAKFR